MSEIAFQDLPLGACFRFPLCLGYVLLRKAIYFKTGPGSYGLHKDEPLFPWIDEVPYVETDGTSEP